jgi:glyoxylase-like metal-dependent hydrolase (beta-lactamase superfamily II)
MEAGGEGRQRSGKGTLMALEIFFHKAVGPLQCNCYVVGDPASRRAIVIDPGGDASELASAIAEQSLTVTAIVATHAHFDHPGVDSGARERPQA